MAISISRYVDPGVYIQEVTGPGSISVTSERIMVLVGTAPRTRRSINEQVVRGKIYAEELTLATSSPHISQALANKSDRSRNEATLYMNGNELGLGDWSFNSAVLVGEEWGGLTINVSSSGTRYLTLGVDGKMPITLDLNALVATPAAATGAALVAGINAGLVAHPSYGSAYASFASVATGITNPIITFTSPDATPLSSIRLFQSMVSAEDAAATISANEWTVTATAGYEASTTITVVDRAYNSAAAYTLDYQSVDTLLDPLAQAATGTNLTDILNIGTYPGGVDYREGIDFQETGNTVDWDTMTQAIATSQDLAANLPVINSGVNDKLSIEINEGNPLVVTLTGGATRSTGSATSTSAGNLVDSAADFVTDAVIAGDIVENVTQGTATTVDSVTNLTTLDLADDIFVSGDEYRVRAVLAAKETGSATSTSAGELIDSAADFVTQDVVAGDVVHNTTDNTFTTVVSRTNLTTLVLADDIFISGDAYVINTPVTAASIIADVNSALNESAAYGPVYSHVAVAVGNTITFTAPSPFANYPAAVGYASALSFASVTNDAFATIFGSGIDQPYNLNGVGLRPAFGTSYYTTYDYVRPSTDYTVAHRVYDVDQLWNYTTQLTLGNYLRNDLCVAGEVAFENGVSSLYLIQVNDQTVEGQPSQTQINTAIDVAEEYRLITEVVTLDTSLETAVYQMRHVANQSSLLEKHYRRGWFGMARDTSVGDPDTPNTFVYRATQTLQPGNTSAGRGRLVLVAPGNASRILTLDDGREVEVDLDGTYISAAVCALSTSLAGPAEVLINKTIAGFKGEGFGTYLRGERHTLADNGVTVVTYEAGNFDLIDPVTTENGGSKVIQYVEPSASPQKDAVTVTVDKLLDSNVKGLVPDDLADFISEIKKWIVLGILANINNGTIAPYRDNNGFTRDIDATTDIQVYQSSTDPRVFYFKYWYNLRYPAKWFFGEYSVDNPFFSPS